MDKTYRRTYDACGTPVKVIIVKKGYRYRDQQIKTIIDKDMIEKIEGYYRCSICRKHKKFRGCDCSQRFCTLNFRRIRSYDPLTGCIYRRRDKRKSLNSGKASTGSDSFGTTSERSDERWHESQWQWNSEHLRSEGVQKHDARVKTSEEETDSEILPRERRFCICGRRSTGPSPHHCDHDDTEEEEDFEFFKALDQFSEPFSYFDEWSLARENNFNIGDILQVQVTARESMEYCWMRLIENLPLYERLKNFFKENYDKFPVMKPDINNYFLTEYEGVWCRGKIIARSPEIFVRCVDTGVTFSPKSIKCRKLNHKLRILRALAFRVNYLDDGENEGQNKRTTPIGIKVIDIQPKGIYEVKLLNSGRSRRTERNFRSKLVQKIKSCRRNVLDDVNVGMSGLFATTHVQDKVITGCLVPDDVEDAVLSFRHVRDMNCFEGEQETEAEVGDLVLVGKTKETGWRGIVKSKTDEYGYEVILVDMGFAVFTKNIFQMPTLSTDLMDLATRLTITFKSPKSLVLNPRHNYYFQIKERIAEQKWSCSLKMGYEDDYFPAQGIIERANEDLHRIMYVPFESGCVVKISALSQHMSEIIVYVRRVDNEEKLIDISEGIIEKDGRMSNRKFWDEIEVGDMVGAKYDDGLYYRASVISRTGGRIGVLFVDYGNERLVKVTDLRRLPFHLLNEPRYARRVELIESDNSVSRGGFPYLETLMETSQPLILLYEDDISDGVLLMEKKDYDPPVNMGVEYPVPDNFTEDFFKLCTLSTGTVRNFVVLYIDKKQFEKRSLFWGVNPNVHHGMQRFEEIKISFGKYCRANRLEYSPKTGELCFALYRGEWCRGLIKQRNDDVFKVFLVDYGNITFVTQESIRKVEVSYFEMPPLAMRCTLQGFDEFSKEEIDIAYTYLRDKINDVIKKAEILKVDDVSTVYIPEMAQLFPDRREN